MVVSMGNDVMKVYMYLNDLDFILFQKVFFLDKEYNCINSKVSIILALLNNTNNFVQ